MSLYCLLALGSWRAQLPAKNANVLSERASESLRVLVESLRLKTVIIDVRVVGVWKWRNFHLMKIWPRREVAALDLIM
jgi:hypothetical protein